MPDFLVKDIDSSIADRIKRIARERGWPINDVFLHLIKQALGMEQAEEPLPGDIARLSGSFEGGEADVFAEALAALKDLPDDTPY